MSATCKCERDLKYWYYYHSATIEFSRSWLNESILPAAELSEK